MGDGLNCLLQPPRLALAIAIGNQLQRSIERVLSIREQVKLDVHGRMVFATLNVRAKLAPRGPPLGLSLSEGLGVAGAAS